MLILWENNKQFPFSNSIGYNAMAQFNQTEKKKIFSLPGMYVLNSIG
jgi:hypothetical protein